MWPAVQKSKDSVGGRSLDKTSLSENEERVVEVMCPAPLSGGAHSPTTTRTSPRPDCVTDHPPDTSAWMREQSSSQLVHFALATYQPRFPVLFSPTKHTAAPGGVHRGPPHRGGGGGGSEGWHASPEPPVVVLGQGTSPRAPGPCAEPHSCPPQRHLNASPFPPHLTPTPGSGLTTALEGLAHPGQASWAVSGIAPSATAIPVSGTGVVTLWLLVCFP